jgi:hypothetical protein
VVEFGLGAKELGLTLGEDVGLRRGSNPASQRKMIEAIVIDLGYTCHIDAQRIVRQLTPPTDGNASARPRLGPNRKEGQRRNGW